MKKMPFFDNSLLVIGVTILSASLLAGTTVTGGAKDNNLRYAGNNFDTRSLASLRIYDSIQTLRQCEDAQRSTLQNAVLVGPIGVNKMEQVITCGSPVVDSNAVPSYYFLISGFRMSQDAGFFVKQNKFFLKTVKQNPGDPTVGDYETREIPLRYVAPDQASSSASGYVLFPISKQCYGFFKIIVIALTVLLSLLGLFYCIIRPLQTIINISKGLVFSKTNTRNLVTGGRLLLAFAIAPFLVQLLCYIVLLNKIPSEFSLAFPQTLFENKGLFIAGLIMLLLAKAFEKGYRIQKENSSIL